jgi:hypothetical protein
VLKAFKFTESISNPVSSNPFSYWMIDQSEVYRELLQNGQGQIPRFFNPQKFVSDEQSSFEKLAAQWLSLLKASQD